MLGIVNIGVIEIDMVKNCCLDILGGQRLPSGLRRDAAPIDSYSIGDIGDKLLVPVVEKLSDRAGAEVAKVIAQ